MANFKAGDLVRLKSGGPTMTVGSHALGNRYECKWFSGSKLNSGHFDADVLVTANEATDAGKKK